MPLYSLGVLIVMKIMVPNPNFPEISEPRGEAKLFEHFLKQPQRIAIVPTNNDTLVLFCSQRNKSTYL